MCTLIENRWRKSIPDRRIHRGEQIGYCAVEKHYYYIVDGDTMMYSLFQDEDIWIQYIKKKGVVSLKKKDESI